MLLNNECVKTEIKEEIKRYHETTENENPMTQNLSKQNSPNKNSPKREINSITGQSQENKKNLR